MNQIFHTYTTIYTENSFKDFAYVLYKLRGKLRKILTLLFAAFFGINGILMVPSGASDIPTALLMIVLSVIVSIFGVFSFVVK